MKPYPKVSVGFEPLKLFAVTGRLTEWADPDGDNDILADVRTDVRWLLASHLDYFNRYEKWEKAYWYQQDTEDNGGHAVSWRERAEELERKLEAAKSVLWMAQAYARSQPNRFGGPGSPDHEFEAAMEVIDG